MLKSVNENVAQKTGRCEKSAVTNPELNKKLSVIALLVGAGLCSSAMAGNMFITPDGIKETPDGTNNHIGSIIISNGGDDNKFNTPTDANILGQKNTISGDNDGKSGSLGVIVVGDANNIKNSNASDHGGVINGTTTKRETNIFGSGNITDGGDINITGSQNNIKGDTNLVNGNNNKLTGSNSNIFGSQSTVNADNAVAIGNNSTNDRDNTVSFGSDGSERQLTNVGKGTADTDAVNVKQLNDKAQETLNSANSYTDSKAQETLNSANSYTDNQITENNKVINQNIDNAKNEAISSSNQYTDLKITDTKNELNQNIDNSKKEAITTSNNYTDNRITDNNVIINSNINNAKNEAINTSNDYTDNKFNQLNGKTDARFNQVDKRIAKLENKVNSGLAGVTAISSIPYVTQERFSFGMGVGNYSNGNAIAAGAQYKPTENTNVRLNFSWDNESNSAIGAGVAFGF